MRTHRQYANAAIGLTVAERTFDLTSDASTPVDMRFLPSNNDYLRIRSLGISAKSRQPIMTTQTTAFCYIVGETTERSITSGPLRLAAPLQNTALDHLAGAA